MQAPTTQAAQSSNNPAPQAPKGINAIDKAVDLTETVSAIVKEVAEVLQHAPYVKMLSGVVLQFIKIRAELKINKERCREIIDKVLNLSQWIYDKLAAIAKSGERVKENLAQVESSLKFCASTLTNVLEELKKHQARPKLVKFVSRGLEELNKLDRSMDGLEKRLVRDIVFDIKLQQGMSASSENTDLASGPSTGGHAKALPPKPYLIVERQAQINSMLDILLGTEPSRIAILGGGGFGKTTLARAILHDPKISDRYHSRYFLSCEGMADVDALLLGLGSMLGITSTPSAMLASIRSLLATSTTLMCLDNFETPWEPSTTRTKIEDVLASLADISNLSIIITMRGAQRPSKIAWSQPLLPPLSTLSAESARLILQIICPDHIVNNFTQQLLDGIDGIALAVTLIANLFRDGESSQSLWQRWSKKQTRVIHTGADDRESSLSTSISLSVESHRMKRDPDAMILLAALSLLPSGFCSDIAALGKLEEYLEISDIHSTLQTLRIVSLIETKTSAWIQMLSPVRLFCLESHSSTISLVLEKVVDYYICIMLRAKNTDNAELYAQIVPEIQNVHSVFQRVYKVGYSQDISRLIDATSYLINWSRYIGYLTQDTIQLALKSSVNIPILHAKCLVSHGDLYDTEGQHSRAKICFKKAAVLFKHANNTIWEAMALEKCGDMLLYMGQLDEAEVTLKEVLALYTQANDKQGIANVRFSLGYLYRNKNLYLEADATLTDALEAFKNISDLLGEANAAQNLTQLHLTFGDLVKAEKFATESLDAAKQAHYALGEGNSLWALGRIHLALDRVSDARQPLEQALSIHKQLSDPISQLNVINDLAQVYIQCDQLSAAEALLTVSAKMELDVDPIPVILATLGWLYIGSDHLDKAEPLLDDALRRFQKSERKDRQAEVLAYLGTVYLKSDRLGDAERALGSITNLNPPRKFRILQLWILGDLYTLKGEFKDSEALLDVAMALCQNRQTLYSYQQGNILRSMGILRVKQGRIDLAIAKFKEAREFHRKAQWISEQATDLKRLGEAYEMLERTEEAEVVFKEAEELMESVREARALKE